MIDESRDCRLSLAAKLKNYATFQKLPHLMVLLHFMKTTTVEKKGEQVFLFLLFDVAATFLHVLTSA